MAQYSTALIELNKVKKLNQSIEKNDQHEKIKPKQLVSIKRPVGLGLLKNRLHNISNKSRICTHSVPLIAQSDRKITKLNSTKPLNFAKKQDNDYCAHVQNVEPKNCWRNAIQSLNTPIVMESETLSADMEVSFFNLLFIYCFFIN